MSYKDLLEKYKNHELSAEEETSIEKEIEKQDAISDYLMEKLESEMAFDREKFAKEESDHHSDGFCQEMAFEKFVKKSIRRSFLKMGIAVCAVVLAVVLFIQFALSPLISHFYYDPGREIVENGSDQGFSYSLITNQMSQDLAVFSEVTLPGKMRDSVRSIPLGYGTYAVTLNQSVVYHGKRRYGIGGQIVRGRLELYDPDYLSPPSSNLFASYGLLEDSGLSYEEQLKKQQEENAYTWYYTTTKDAMESLKALSEDEVYTAYVTLNKRFTFSEMNTLIRRILDTEIISGAELWQGVCTFDGNYQYGLGYLYDINHQGFLLSDEERERYPLLSLGSGYESIRQSLDDEESMENHFTSMLQYIIDHQSFLKMIGEASGLIKGEDGLKQYTNYFESALRYVRENGLTYYGFVCLAKKDEMIALMNDPQILGVVAEECN